MTFDAIGRAWGLYWQLQAQRAVLKDREAVRRFVAVRQMEAEHTVEAVTDKLWEILCRLRGDLDPDWNAK